MAAILLQKIMWKWRYSLRTQIQTLVLCPVYHKCMKIVDTMLMILLFFLFSSVDLKVLSSDIVDILLTILPNEQEVSDNIHSMICLDCCGKLCYMRYLGCAEIVLVSCGTWGIWDMLNWLTGMWYDIIVHSALHCITGPSLHWTPLVSIVLQVRNFWQTVGKGFQNLF